MISTLILDDSSNRPGAMELNDLSDAIIDAYKYDLLITLKHIAKFDTDKLLRLVGNRNYILYLNNGHSQSLNLEKHALITIAESIEQANKYIEMGYDHSKMFYFDSTKSEGGLRDYLNEVHRNEMGVSDAKNLMWAYNRKTLEAHLKKKYGHIKLFVGVPTYFYKEYCVKEFFKGLKTLIGLPIEIQIVILDNSKDDNNFTHLMEQYRVELGIPSEVMSIIHTGFDLGGSLNSREAVTMTRNRLRDMTLEGGFTHFLSLESDIIMDDFSSIRILMDTSLDGVVFTYSQKEKCYEFYSGVDQRKAESWEKGYDRYTVQVYRPPPGIHKVYGGTLGCTLIPRKVLSKLGFRCDLSMVYFDDVHYAIDLNEKHGDVEIYGDSLVTYKHMSQHRIQFQKLWDNEKGYRRY